jgi:hypothetical protein
LVPNGTRKEASRRNPARIFVTVMPALYELDSVQCSNGKPLPGV